MEPSTHNKSIDFFTRNESIIAFHKALSNLGEPTDDFKSNILSQIINDIIANGEEWNKNCHYTLGTLEDYYKTNVIRSLITIDNKNIDESLFIAIYRLYAEYDFHKNTSFGGMGSIKRIIKAQYSTLSRNLQEHIDFFETKFYYEILRDLARSPNMGKAYELLTNESRLHDLEKSIQDNIDGKINQVLDLRSALEKLKTEYNFVGLHHGFRNLRREKVKSIARLEDIIFILGFFLTFLICIQVLFSPSFDIKRIPQMIAAAALDVAIVFFIRIALANFNQTKSELIQLDLRITLCQFFEEYVKYAQEHHSKNPTTFDKFESLIFNDLDNTIKSAPIPDSLDSLLNILKSKPPVQK